MIKTKKVVSVNIPTWNSDKTLKSTLDSIKDQTYKEIEIIIIDSNSKDNTIKIAKECGAKVIPYSGKLLGARYEGVKHSGGDFVLLLDSDQILKPDCIARAVEVMSKFDMLVLEEFTYKPRTWIQKLYEADRRLVHHVADLDPYTSVLLPRFYSKELLFQAFENMPPKVLPKVGGQDHAIIYLEAFRISKKVAILSDCVYHIEPATMVDVIRKNYRWGKTSRDLEKIGKYEKLLKRKVRFRKAPLKDSKTFLSFLLLIIKGIPYKFGYYSK